MLKFWKAVPVLSNPLPITRSQALPGLLCLTLLLACGCPTPPKSARPTPLAPRPASAPVEPEPAPSQNLTRQSFPLPPVDPWISWALWASDNGLGSLQKQSHLNASPSFSMTTPAGRLAAHAGSRIATWNEAQLWLGHGPRLSPHNHPELHYLDLLKTIKPLVENRPFQLPPNSLIMIDPGHGGENRGARSTLTADYEKDLTLDWALRLKPLLEQHGWHVQLTRESDLTLSLLDRVLLADQAGADLFISLHFNSASPHAAGIETYCLTPTGLPSTITRQFPDDITRTYPNNQFDDQNLALALRVHRSLLLTTGAPDRGVRRARFMTVIREQNRPAILVEGGFLSNPREAKDIAGAGYRQKLAEAVAHGLLH